jgi:hypothetical protein
MYAFIYAACFFFLFFWQGGGERFYLNMNIIRYLKGQKKLVFLKQPTSCVFVNTIRMVLNQVLDPLFDIV